MTTKENIRAILECYFAGFKEEIIDDCCNRICYQLKLEKPIESEDMSEQERWKKGL